MICILFFVIIKAHFSNCVMQILSVQTHKLWQMHVPMWRMPVKVEPTSTMPEAAPCHARSFPGHSWEGNSVWFPLPELIFSCPRNSQEQVCRRCGMYGCFHSACFWDLTRHHMYQFNVFYCWVPFHYTDIPRFVYPFFCRWIFVGLPVWDHDVKAVRNTLMEVISWAYIFILSLSGTRE